MNYLRQLFIILLIGCTSFPVFGELSTQTFTLNPGWNAVYLEVQPQPEQSDQVFQNIPVKSVWAWNRQFSSVQFIEDMSTMIPERPEWLTYFPEDSGKSFLTNLYSIQGGKAYLINIDSNTPVTLTINGVSTLPAYEWMPNSFNLVGFHIQPNTTTVKQFLSHSAAHKGQPVYQLNESGRWDQLNENELLQPGKSYWVFCKGTSGYHGTFFPILEQGKSLDFGSLLNEQVLRIKNDTPSTNIISISPQSSEVSTKSLRNTSTSTPKLNYWSDTEQKWIHFSNTLSITIPANSDTAIRLAIQRSISTTKSNTAIEGLLDISDNQGTHYRIPVSAQSLSSNRSGLWVGVATINMVSCPSCGYTKTPIPTGSEFKMRLIIHVDETGQARLLQHVTLLWKSGTQKSDPENSDIMIVDQPGEYVLITDDSLIKNYSGAAVRDNKLVGRRLSTAAFSFSEPIPMTGTFNGVSGCSIIIDEDDPLNPFKHKFHPDHDNLNYSFEPFDKDKIRFTKESYTIGRTIRLTFEKNPPEDYIDIAWGSTILGGQYHETLQGVHNQDIYVEGTFELRMISKISKLNDGK